MCSESPQTGLVIWDYGWLSRGDVGMDAVMMAISLPFYGLAHFFIKNKLKEDLNISCSENIK
jgi:hypothetical protein